MVTCSHAFSRTLRQLHAITFCFDWFSVLSVSFVIGWEITLVLVLRHSIENRSKTLNYNFELANSRLERNFIQCSTLKVGKSHGFRISGVKTFKNNVNTSGQSQLSLWTNQKKRKLTNRGKTGDSWWARWDSPAKLRLLFILYMKNWKKSHVTVISERMVKFMAFCRTLASYRLSFRQTEL